MPTPTNPDRADRIRPHPTTPSRPLQHRSIGVIMPLPPTTDDVKAQQRADEYAQHRRKNDARMTAALAAAYGRQDAESPSVWRPWPSQQDFDMQPLPPMVKAWCQGYMEAENARREYNRNQAEWAACRGDDE